MKDRISRSRKARARLRRTCRNIYNLPSSGQSENTSYIHRALTETIINPILVFRVPRLFNAGLHNKTMRFVRQALVPLVLVIAVTFASNPIELLVPEARIRAVSQPLATPPPATDVFSWDMNVAIQRRARYGQPAQKPLNGCPEVFDYPRMGCESCGGEDPAHPGTCSKPTSTGGWRCACMSSAPIRSL